MRPHLTPLGTVLAFIAALLLICALLAAFEGARAGGPTPYPTALLPPVMWTATPPPTYLPPPAPTVYRPPATPPAVCCYVYMPMLIGGSAYVISPGKP